MIDIKIDIKKNAIENISEKNIKKAIWNSVNDLLIFMDWVAIKVTPIRTWFLRKWFKKINNWLKGNFFNDVKYAPHVNFWTKRQKSNPFMENILKESEEKIEKIFNNNFDKTLW